MFKISIILLLILYGTQLFCSSQQLDFDNYWKDFEEDQGDRLILKEKLSHYKDKKMEKREHIFFRKSHLLKYFFYYELNENIQQFSGKMCTKGRPTLTGIKFKK